MSRICPLYSGSTGNSTYIGTENTGILIDSGASCKGICEGLCLAGASLEEITAVAVTHCHDDHIKGLKTVLKRSGAALLGSEETVEALISKGLVPEGTPITVMGEKPVTVGDMELSSFATSHDSLGSCGYRLNLPDGKVFSLCTDTGILTDEIKAAISGSDAVLLESNHDVEMLKNGPYPPILKVRIMSDRGHISNAVCAGEVLELFKSGTTRFVLGHLSLNNNTPALAKTTSESVLMDIGAVNLRDYILSVAAPKLNRVTVL